MQLKLFAMSTNFYPRPPRGGRHAARRDDLSEQKFLSTPSARRATGEAPPSCWRKTISIHALREEGDRWACPVGPIAYISIHALREEGD